MQSSSYDARKVYYESSERFKDMTDVQLVDAFNREVRGSGSPGARMAYISALRKEFENRGFDYSAIGSNGKMSLAKKVKLLDKKILLDEI